MRSWGIGVLFDSRKLAYNGSRRPPDHVFSYPESQGATPQAPMVLIEDVNETHKILKWGYAYLWTDEYGNPIQWGFNGSGVLCQIRFKIVGAVNETYPKWLTFIGFDPEWTAIYQFPTKTLIPKFASGTVRYLYPSTPRIATLNLNPKKIIDATLTPCKNFKINLTVINATDLYRWQTEIYYKSQVINVTNVAEGSFLKTYGTTMFEVNINREYNATHGKITLMQTLLHAELGAYGDGQLAELTFHVLDLGDTPISIFNDKLYNSEGIEIAHATEHGYFSNILLAKISIEPAEIRDPTYVPCTYFEISIVIGDVENLKRCIFNLTYNPHIIMETSITVPKVLGQTPIKYLLADDYNGYIWANLTYPNPITTYTPITIITITFHVEAMGVSPINLENTRMEDPAGNGIIHEVNNGMFVGIIRDIAITNIETELNIAYAGWPVRINVTVKNEGNLTETFSLKVCYDANLIDTKIITDLNPSMGITITFVWNTSSAPPCHDYIISAEVAPLPYEINTANNILTDGTIKIKLMGDINGDRIVDMTDINVFLEAYGAIPIHPRWNLDADLYRDRKIDMTDLILILNNFGKTC
jgi:hypothetical protein